MKTVLEHIRAGMNIPECKEPLPDLEQLRRTEWNPEFEKLMRNRLLMGAMRYGEFRHKKKSKL
jgi:hypothetical protein